MKKSSCKADVGFLLDGSGSINREDPSNWRRVLNFVKDVAKGIKISDDGAHASVTVFSASPNPSKGAEVLIKFGDHTDVSSFQSSVDVIEYPNSMTDTLAGLDVALNEMFTRKSGMRPEAPKTLIYVTDGACECDTNIADSCFGDPDICSPTEMKKYAAKYEEKGIKMIGIGVGWNIAEDEILLIVDEENYHPSLDFKELTSNNFLRNLLVCDGTVNINE